MNSASTKRKRWLPESGGAVAIRYLLHLWHPDLYARNRIQPVTFGRYAVDSRDTSAPLRIPPGRLTEFESASLAQVAGVAGNCPQPARAPEYDRAWQFLSEMYDTIFAGVENDLLRCSSAMAS
jgi:hypothetical protein